QGKLPVSTSASVNFSSSDMAKLGTPPPGAIGFFIGDQTGGSGWEIELPDGTNAKSYVELRESMAKAQQHVRELPVQDDDDLKKECSEGLCEYYLKELEGVVDGARKAFLGEDAQRAGGKRLAPYLRVVK